jgi:serine/threonine protein kinase
MEVLHAQNFIHRDIKPENFLIGHGKKQGILYMIDYGLSKRFKDPKTGLHNQFNKKNGIVGTPRYCSIAAHSEMEQSRRDDLEAIGYMLVFFLKDGFLPWMRAEGDGEQLHKELEKQL